MICRVADDGTLQKVQLASHPQCALFRQDFVDEGSSPSSSSSIHVRYLTPEQPLLPHRPEHDTILEVPLYPDTSSLERADVNLYQSMVSAYRMGPKYDAWFSACFGFDAVFLYIGDQRRPVLGTFSPKTLQQKQQQQQQQSKNNGGFLSSIKSYVTGSSSGNQDDGDDDDDEPDWITFADLAPYLITTESSLANVRARLDSGDVDMVKFRPNIVLDGETEFAEDFWSELSLRRTNTNTNTDDSSSSSDTPAFIMSKMCGRCVSVNVDYATGRPADGERGTVLKKLMPDRRVDSGKKTAPVFGRYAFLSDALVRAAAAGEDTRVSVGDEVGVLRTSEERPAWDWPDKDPSAARFYGKKA